MIKEVFFCDDIREIDRTKYVAMIVPCDIRPLVVTKSNDGMEYGTCPKCGARIYIDYPIMGHDF